MAIYVATLAPGVTFWDAGEFIAAAHVLGIPHPPGTPLYIALAHAWTMALGPLFGVARAVNLLSAACTASAGAAMAWLVARRSTSHGAGWMGLAAALAAGTMMSVWSNATETEVYAASLLHSVAMLVTASLAGEDDAERGARWAMLTAYLIALAPAVHLSALVAAPAAIVLAARSTNAEGARIDGATTIAARARVRPRGLSSGWRVDRVMLLGGALIAAAGVGRADWRLGVAGVVLVLLAPLRVATRMMAAAAIVLASSAIFVLLVRAKHDPAINQGAPFTWSALADVVGRRQYDVAPMLPRQAPVWLQTANVLQYVDWQAAMSWGRGIMTSPARVIAALVWLALGWKGWREMRRDARSLADSLAVMFVCGTLGVAVYLNLKAGASLGWGILPDSAPHEARERDYFFVLGFWAWGSFAGYGAVALARASQLPAAVGLVAILLPLAGNWRSADRSREATRTAARTFAFALLDAAPRDAVLFVDGDNDTYPLWYLQQVEGVRRDVLPVTIPLLPASWYPQEIARRTGWRWSEDVTVAGARTLSEQRAALIAQAARAAGRSVAASPALPARERALLGADWVMRGPVYVAGSGGGASAERAVVDSVSAVRWLARAPEIRREQPPPADDVAWWMLRLLQCPRLALADTTGRAQRDSLEVTCNLR